MSSARIDFKAVINFLSEDVDFLTSQVTTSKNYNQALVAFETSNRLSKKAYDYLQASQRFLSTEWGKEIDVLWLQVNKAREAFADQLMEMHKDVEKPFYSLLQLKCIKADAALKQMTFYEENKEKRERNHKDITKIKTELKDLMSAYPSRSIAMNFVDVDAYANYHYVFSQYYESLLLHKSKKKSDARFLLERLVDRYQFNPNMNDITDNMKVLLDQSQEPSCCISFFCRGKKTVPLENKYEVDSLEDAEARAIKSEIDYRRFVEVQLPTAPTQHAVEKIVFFDMDKTLIDEKGFIKDIEKLKRFFQEVPPKTKFHVITSRRFPDTVEPSAESIIEQIEKEVGKAIFSSIIYTATKRKHHAMYDVHQREVVNNPVLKKADMTIVDDEAETIKNCKNEGFDTKLVEQGASYIDYLRTFLNMPSETKFNRASGSNKIRSSIYYPSSRQPLTPRTLQQDHAPADANINSTSSLSMKL